MVDDWTIKTLLHQYHTDRYNIRQTNLDLPEIWEKEEELNKLYTQATRLIFSKKEFSFGELMTVENFIKEQECGCFISYDGTGDYVDFDGNELGPVNWNNYHNYPKGTVFVAWYNK